MKEAYGNYTITLDDDSQVHMLIARITKMNSLPFTHAKKLLERASSYTPAALFVDVHLELGISGLDYISDFRQCWPFVPIFVITSDQNLALIGEALSKGANDFIRKPIVPDELQARLEARIVEMREKQNIEEWQIGEVIFNKRLGTLTKGSKILNLPPLEAELLLYLIRNIGLVASKDSIRHYLWGNTKVSENSLDKKISNLRKMIGELDANIVIKTQYGGKIYLQLDPKLTQKVIVKTAC